MKKLPQVEAGNVVFIDADGIIRHVLRGPQTREDIIDLRVATLPLISQLRESNKSVRLLIDVRNVHSTNSDVRIESRKMLEIDFDYMAVVGNRYLQPIVAYVLRTAGTGDKVHYFSGMGQAEAWLANPSRKQSPASTHVLSTITASGWVTLLVLGACVWATFASGNIANERLQTEAAQAFSEEEKRIVQAIDARMRSYTDALMGFRGLFHSSDAINEKEFVDFYGSLELKENYPGFNAISFIERVPRNQRAAFTQQVRADESYSPTANDQFTVVTTGQRDDHFIIRFLSEGGSGKGIDLADNDAQRPVLEAARDSGDFKTTGSITLIDNQGKETGQQGFLLTVPVYKDSVPATQNDRRLQHEGFVNAVFSYQTLLTDILKDMPEDVRITVADSSGGQVYAQGKEYDKAAMTRQGENEVTIAGQTWRLSVAAPLYHGITTVQQRAPRTVYTTGILLSALLCVLFWVQIRGRQKAVRLAGTMTEDLQKERDEALAIKSKDEAILSSIGDGVFAIDQQRRIILFNKVAEKLTGFSAQEAAGKLYTQVLQFRAPDGALRDDFITLALSGKPAEMARRTQLVRRNGEHVPVADSAAPIFDANGKQYGVIVVFRDVTTQLHFEEALQESNERFELAAKATSDVVYDLSIDTGTLQWNEALTSAYGYHDRERNTPLEWWTTRIHPDDAHTVSMAFDKLNDSKVNTWVVEYRFRKADSSYAFVRDRAFVLRDKNGYPTRVIGSMLDITKQKDLDRAKDEFISLVSHQLRTPLTAIRLFGEMLQDGQVGKLAPAQQDYVEKISTSTRRMIQLVGDILNISRIELGRLKIDPQPADAPKIIEQIIEEVQPLAQKRHVAITYSPQKLPPIPLDALLFSQIVHNLLTNAIRYTPEATGKVNITFAKRDDVYELAVSDNGIGIPEEAREHIFQRFFRANNAVKVEGEGTGLGLYLIKLIVEASGGTVRFETQAGKGTTFFVTIPSDGMKSRHGDKSIA